MRIQNNPTTANLSGSYRTPDGKAQIDWRVESGRFSATGNYNGSAGQCLDEIRKDYPDNLSVQNLCQIWQCWHLCPLPAATVQTLRVYIAIYSNVTDSFYDHQANRFLADNRLKFRATLSDTKSPQWEGAEDGERHHFRVTISRPGKHYDSRKASENPREWEAPANRPKMPPRIVFDFWSSIADAKAGITTVTPYSVLACISGDIYTPETFKDFCAEYGYDSDSITALQQFRRCHAFAKRLRAFFTEAEQEQLSEIR